MSIVLMAAGLALMMNVTDPVYVIGMGLYLAGLLMWR